MTAAAPNQPKGLYAKLFEPKRLGIMAPGTSVLVYAGLLFWTIVVLFPLYWLLVTSFKLPIDVNEGPRYLPFVDYEPSLHAWDYLLVEVGGDTFRPYVNSVIIAAISTILAVLAGSMAAYALARITYKPRFASILSFVVGIIAVIVLTVVAGVPWWLSLIVGLAIFALLARTVARRFSARLGNGDILFWMISQRILPPVIVAVPVYTWDLGTVDYPHLGSEPLLVAIPSPSSINGIVFRRPSLQDPGKSSGASFRDPGIPCNLGLVDHIARAV